MKTKLTLSIDRELAKYAHEHAHRHGQSISGMFSDFLLAKQVRPKAKKAIEVNDMVGSLKGYKIDDSKSGIHTAYAQKYLRRS